MRSRGRIAIPRCAQTGDWLVVMAWRTWLWPCWADWAGVAWETASES
jgi:hypothetical protein